MNTLPAASRHLISTRAKDDACWCGAAVIVGLDEGLTAKVDAAVLDQAGEIAALLDNRRTLHAQYESLSDSSHARSNSSRRLERQCSRPASLRGL